MKPLRKYDKADIYFRNQQHDQYYEVNVYSNLVIYMDVNGTEWTTPMSFIKDIVHYPDPAKQP